MKSLKIKLVCIISALVLVLLLVECLAANYFMQDSFKKELTKEYSTRASFYETIINGWCSEEVGILDGVQAITEVASQESDSVTKALEQITSEHEEISLLYVCLSDGTLLNGSSWSPSEGWDGRTRSWYQEAVAAEGNIVYGAPYVDDYTGKVVLTFSKYFNANGCEGVVAMDLMADTLISGIDPIVPIYGNEGDYVIVASEDGTIIHHVNADFMPTTGNLTNVSDLLGGKYVQCAEDDTFFTDYTGISSKVVVTHSYVLGWQIYYVSAEKYFTEQCDLVRNKSLMVFAFCLVAGIAVSVLTGLLIAKPISSASKKVNAFCDDVRNGQANLKTQIAIKNKDEVGVLVDGVNDMIGAMGNVIGQIHYATGSLVDDVQTLQDVATTTSINVSTISSAMEEMSATSEETSASTTQVAKQVTDISGMARSMLQNSRQKANELNNDLKNVDELKEKIEKNDENMINKLNAAIDQLQEKIEATKKVEDIQQMTEGIADVASQTNLLSLNASIEAARAGEMGKGFAVVAGEIGSLANNSSQMAQNIQAVSDEVLAIVEQLVKAAKEVSEIMISITQENSKEKKEIIDNYFESLKSCYQVLAEVSDHNEEIGDSMEKIQEAISAIDRASEENASGITSVASSATELVNISDDVLARANSVDNIIKGLQKQIQGFQF